MVIVTGAQGGIANRLLIDLRSANEQCLGITTSDLPQSPVGGGIDYVKVTKASSDQSSYEEYSEIFGLHAESTTGLVLLNGSTRYLAGGNDFLKTFRENVEVNLMISNVIIRAFLDSREDINDKPSCSVVLAGTASADRGGQINQNPGYALAKYALQNIVKAYGKCYAQTLCRFNCVAFGFIDSGIHQKRNKSFSISDRIASIPMGRAGSVEEASAVIQFLLSDESQFINGQTLSVDGGDFI